MASAKIIRNHWQPETEKGLVRARILRHDLAPEGLDVDRIRFAREASLRPSGHAGHLISILQGKITLTDPSGHLPLLTLIPGTHVYVPPSNLLVLAGSKDTELIVVTTATAAQAQGKKLLVRDEVFIAACASGAQSLRWTLTPQYLSRRIFLHHDPILLSKSGHPVSWFHTTMFDVSGLPANEAGEPVFKMSYNSRTEVNVCYKVQGSARVRMALHPYETAKQAWSDWSDVDEDTTYHLNESAGDGEEECYLDEITRVPRFLRNKHEVQINDGHVSLFCLFDPAPTGIERHKPGEYSDYEPLAEVTTRPEYAIHQRELKRFDEMVDELSFAKAAGGLDSCKKSLAWPLYEDGRRAQLAIESKLSRELALDGKGRDRVIRRWLQSGNMG